MRAVLLNLLLLTIGLCGGKDHSKDSKNQKDDPKETMNHCTICMEGFDLFINAVRKGESDLELKKIFEFYCIMHQLSEKNICIDTIDVQFPTIKFVVENTPNITSNQICQLHLQTNKCDIKLEKFDDWDVQIQGCGQMNKRAKNYIPKGSTQNLKILQITDIHYDPVFKIGSDPFCSDPVCCRKMNDSIAIEHRAKRWGSYSNCDTPLDTLVSALEHIKDTHKQIDIIYITGDYVDHADWMTSWAHNFEAISTVFKKITETFPHTPMYPLLGNHEPTPKDVYSPSSIQYKTIASQPLYDFLTDEWKWLPESAKKTIKQGGYYTLVIRPGLRLIAINNNYCMVHNWWLIYDPCYAIERLQWLENTLYDAEQHGENVHILAHVPNGNDKCYKEWAYQYNRIIERYYETISAQFNGHTHRDEFNIYFPEDQPFTPINVAWNGGSISTWLHVNPNYRMYSVEPETYQVTDFETWTFNLTEANVKETNTPRWFFEYSFKDAYNVPDLSPASLFSLVKDMAKNVTNLYKYFEYYVKQGDVGLEMGCNIECYEDLLCQIVSTVFNDGNPRCSYLGNLVKNPLKRVKLEKCKVK